MQEPWIYTSDLHYSVSEDGKSHTEAGIHAIFAAEVPFVPSFMSSDFVGPLAVGASRIQLIINRQINFINDLASIRHDQATFDLRLIYNPYSSKISANQPKIKILFLGKVFSTEQDREKNCRLAVKLWEQFSSQFPNEDPFNYPLVPVTEKWLNNEDDHNGIKRRDPREAFEAYILFPIQPEKINDDCISEVRKFEDWDDVISKLLGVRLESDTSPALRLGYIVHQFCPIFDTCAYNRLLETMVRQTQTCMVRISLRPTWLTDTEIRLLTQLLSEYETQLVSAEGWIKLYKVERHDQMQVSIHNLLTYQRQLFSINIQVIGEKNRPEDLVAVLASEIMGNPSNISANPVIPPQIAKEVRPKPGGHDIELAKSNLCYLEHETWGEKKGGKGLDRIPILVSGYEAAGAFCLPIPPESGFMAGIVVKDEPFVQPQNFTKQESQQILLGEVLHRGTKSGVDFRIPINELARHVLIVGSTGSGKTQTCLNILSQLWGQCDPKIPFLVIYPVAKTDYRVLMGDPLVREKLLIFTAGDSTSPLHFNPFDVPEGILLRTHISNLMRAFSTGMYMWGPLPSLFRHSLRKLYEEECKWKMDDYRSDDPSKQQIPTLKEFYKILSEESEKWGRLYRDDLRGDLRQDAEVKIKDLLDNAESILNVRDSSAFIEKILDNPTVIELGRVGSSTDISLIVGFLVTLLGEHVISRYQKEKRSKVKESTERKGPYHVTLIEEAHRVMPARVSVQGEYIVDPRIGGAEDFAHVLSEVRGYGEAIIIAEQTPTKLIPDAIANTRVKIMHWLEDAPSFDLFSQVMNLNERQRNHARTLNPGQVLMRTATGFPVLIKIPFYNESIKEGLKDVSISDIGVSKFMQNQIEILNVPVPDIEPSSQEADIKDNGKDKIPPTISVSETSTTELNRPINESKDDHDYRVDSLRRRKQIQGEKK